MMKQDMFGLDHVNPSSMDQEHEENSSYLHFPHPFLDYDDLFLTHFLSQQQQQQQQQQLVSGEDCWKEQDQEQEQEKQDDVRHDHETTTKQNSEKKGRRSLEVKKKKKKCSSSNRKNGSSTTKRTGKKDRHSKIYTAHGPRDRRMRLSLQIARKFFDLQDMLGFDKASKTIEWLLSHSNSAIKALKNNHNNNNNSGVSHGSACSGSSEVVSKQDAGGSIGTPKHKKGRQLQRVGRESRARARARARERTMLKKSPQPTSISQHYLNSDETHLEDCPKVFAFSDDLSSIHTFFSGNITTFLP